MVDQDDNDSIILEFYLGEEFNNPDVSELKSFYESRLFIIKDIETGFKRLKDRYPNFYYRSSMYDSSLVFNIFQEVKNFDFYVKSGDLIILNFDKIKDILSLDKDVNFYITSDDQFLIDFDNQDHFIKNMHRTSNFTDKSNLLINNYNDNLDMMEPGSDFDKLVIDGEKIITGRVKEMNIGRNTRYYGSKGSGQRQIWSIGLEINPKLNIEIS